MFSKIYKNAANFFRIQKKSIKQCKCDQYDNFDEVAEKVALRNLSMMGAIIGFFVWLHANDDLAREQAIINKTQFKTFPINNQFFKTKRAKDLVDITNASFAIAVGASIGPASGLVFKYKKPFAVTTAVLAVGAVANIITNEITASDEGPIQKYKR